MYAKLFLYIWEKFREKFSEKFYVGVCKIVPIHVGEILREVCKIVPIYTSTRNNLEFSTRVGTIAHR